MTIETHVDRARDRVRAELEALDAKRTALSDFADRVGDLSPETGPSQAAGVVAGGGTLVDGESATETGCRAVRTAFAESLQPHADAGEASLLAAVRAEFSDSLAVALAPSTGASLTPDLKRTVLAAVDSRQTECVVLHRALEREADSLAVLGETVDETSNWLTAADETPLSSLGFPALRERHETLASYRERCRDRLDDRQSTLETTTSHDGTAGIRQRTLVESLYEDFPVEYPGLSTLARLDSTCADCQRAVRDHLVRQV